MLKGIDISEFQTDLDISKLKNQVDFIIIRSSYGNGYTDKAFTSHRDLVRANNIPCGFYHYAYPQYNSPQEEAAWFLQTVQPQKGELLCLDFEESWPGDSVAWCKGFLDYVSNQLGGYKPLLYINLSISRSLDWSPIINSNYGLWIADWDNNAAGPGHDTPWPMTAIRQYTDKLKVGGIDGEVDGDIFYGDLTSFKAYGYQGNLTLIKSDLAPIVTSALVPGSKVLLPIVPLSQRDTRWANQRLGTVDGTTIGSYGCIVTDMCMLATYYNHPILPNTLDDTLTGRNLYYDGNLFVNQSITTIFPDISFDKVVFCETTPAPIDEIISYLNAGKPSVVALINQGIRHYVLVVGYEGDKIYCNDPWMGDQVAINDRWGDPKLKILQVNFFSGPVPTFTTPTPVIPVPIPVTSTPSQPVVTIPPIPTPTPITPQVPPIIFTAPVVTPTPTPIPAPVPTPIIPQPTPISNPVTVTVPPIDTTQIQDLVNQGLQQLQNTIAEVAYNTSLNPTVQKTTNQIFIDSLKSRKLILTGLASLTALVNSVFKLQLTQDQLMIVILPILSYIIVEGGADIVSRFKTAQQP